MCSVNLPNIYAIPSDVAPSLLGTSVLGYVMLGIIALGGFFIFVFCFGSLIYLIVRSFKHEKIAVDSTNISENIKAGMSKADTSEFESKPVRIKAKRHKAVKSRTRRTSKVVPSLSGIRFKR